MNADGRADVVMTDGCVWLQRSDGTFPLSCPAPIFAKGVTVAVGDLNGDGLPDVVGDQGIVFNNGGGSFAEFHPLGILDGYPYGIAVGDVNGDGRLDVVETDTVGPDAVFLNQGNGTFLEQRLPNTFGDYAVAIGDLNGDGASDLVVASLYTNDVHVLLNHGDGSFAVSQRYDFGRFAEIPSISIADMNGDGSSDLVIGGGSVYVLLNNGDGTFPQPLQPVLSGFGGSGVLRSAAVGDLNGDGKPDIAVGHEFDPTFPERVSVLLNTTTPPTRATVTALTVDPSPALAGQAVTLAATVTAGGSAVGAGTVTFEDGGTVIAAGVPVDALGHASFATSALPLGLHSLTAHFDSAPGFGASTSASVALGVYDYSLKLDPAQQTIQRGSPAAYTVTATLANGSAIVTLPPTLDLTFSGLPSGAVPSLTHALATPTAGSPTMTELDIATDATTAVGDSTVSVSGPGPRTSSAHLYVNAPPVPAASGPYVVDEGGSITLNGAATDTDADTLTYAWDLDGNGTFETPGASPVFAAGDGPATRNVALQVCDDHGACASDATTVTVRNVAPTATLNAPASVEEGSTFTVSLGGGSDPSAADAAALRYAFSCDGAPLPGSYVGASAAPSTTCSFDDGPSDHTITARVYDKDGGSTGYSQPVHVTNVAPTGSFPTAATIDEGGHVTLAFTNQHDPSAQDTTAGFMYQYSCDGGQLGAASNATSVSCPSGDGPSDHVVLARISDKDGASTDYSATVHVTNVAPRADVANSGPVAEASAVTVSLSNASDPSSADAASLHYLFDCSGGPITGGYSAGSASPSASCTFDDGPSDHTVAARIVDKDGGSTDYSTVVHVTNAPPTATLPATAAVDEGSLLTVAFANPQDPSTADAGAGFHYAYDCNNGSLTGSSYASAQSSPNLTCTYPDGPATPTLRARIYDRDGGFTEYTVGVTVRNLAPVVAFTGGDTTINEGSDPTVVHSYSYRATDAGHDALHFVSSDCGVGQKVAASDAFDPVTGNGSFKCTFPASFLADGTATSSTNVSATVGDKDGGNGVGGLAVRVANVAPTVSIAQPLNGVTYAVNTTVTLTATFVDSSKLDQPHVCAVDWSDGTSPGVVTEAAGSTTGRCTATHVYKLGGGRSYKITASVKDKDGDSGSKAVTITVIG